MFYIIFLFYLLMLLAVAIAKGCNGGFSSESDEIMRMEYEQKIQEIRRKTERLQKENERLRKIKL